MLELLKKLKKRECFLILVCVVFIVAQVWLDLKVPDYMSEITQLVETEGSKMTDILKNGGFMVLCAFGSLISAVIVGYIASFVAATFSKVVRKDIFSKVESFSSGEVKKFSTSSLITRATNDVTQVQMLLAMGMQLLIKSPIMAVWAIMKILNKGWQWSLLTAGAVAILVTTILILMSIVLPRFKRVQKLIDNINDITRENLTGIRVVRAFNAEKYQEDKFSKANDNLTNNQLFNQRAMQVLSPMMNLVMYGLTLGIYFIGAYLLDAALMSEKLTIFGNMVVFSSYAMQVIMSFVMLIMIFIMYPRAAVSARRINEVLDEPLSILDGEIVENQTGLQGTVEFKNVSFQYPDAESPMLHDISFKIEKGQTLAIIGSTGCGKTTLIQLIPRLFDTTSGDVFVNGVNVKDYNLDYLHNIIGYIPQKAVMFSGSVKFNVGFGEPKQEITEEKIKEAIKVAQGKDFVEKMSKKYDAPISQGGTNVSGGQKQRLAIARAIARDPEIYIFDDSFSALDYKTDAVLRNELKKYTKDATSIIVAQRIGTIINADKIIVLDNGKCVGIGTHKELLKKCKVYQEIALSQLSKEELENA
ncbi:MAG: ABC transporter ATP-binding protein/permease [Bacilli bacterium]|nr:ABC transporter ATP-binding protein/permease [Bacilli bacterium]